MHGWLGLGSINCVWACIVPDMLHVLTSRCLESHRGTLGWNPVKVSSLWLQEYNVGMYLQKNSVATAHWSSRRVTHSALMGRHDKKGHFVMSRYYRCPFLSYQQLNPNLPFPDLTTRVRHPVGLPERRLECLSPPSAISSLTAVPLFSNHIGPRHELITARCPRQTRAAGGLHPQGILSPSPPPPTAPSGLRPPDHSGR